MSIFSLYDFVMVTYPLALFGMDVTCKLKTAKTNKQNKQQLLFVYLLMFFFHNLPCLSHYVWCTPMICCYPHLWQRAVGSDRSEIMTLQIKVEEETRLVWRMSLLSVSVQSWHAPPGECNYMSGQSCQLMWLFYSALLISERITIAVLIKGIIITASI